MSECLNHSCYAKAADLAFALKQIVLQYSYIKINMILAPQNQYRRCSVVFPWSGWTGAFHNAYADGIKQIFDLPAYGTSPVVFNLNIIPVSDILEAAADTWPVAADTWPAVEVVEQQRLLVERNRHRTFRICTVVCRLSFAASSISSPSRILGKEPFFDIFSECWLLWNYKIYNFLSFLDHFISYFAIENRHFFRKVWSLSVVTASKLRIYGPTLGQTHLKSVIFGTTEVNTLFFEEISFMFLFWGKVIVENAGRWYFGSFVYR